MVQKHHVVFLEAANAPKTDFAFPHTCTRHVHTRPDQVAERIKDATIVIDGVVPITPADLDQAPKLECLALTATGFDWLDKQAFADRGITVVNCPQNNVEAVAEHFLALYFAARRKVVEVHNAVTGPGREWIQEGSLTPRWQQGAPLSCQQETLGIIGYGALGHQIEHLAKAVGFRQILIAERKGDEKVRPGRMPFTEAISGATTLVVCCPKDVSTIGLISEPELHSMKPETLLLNMSRGGVVDEHALASALRERRIFGAATDVLETEPGGAGTTPLIPDLTVGQSPVPNLTVTAHVAWFSQQTMINLDRLLKLGVEGHVHGTLQDPPSLGTAIVAGGKIWR